MDENIVVVMLRDAQTGFLEKEAAVCRVENDGLLVNIVAEAADGGQRICMKVSTERDAADWEFNAIYDYYDGDVFQSLGAACAEIEDCENPTWELLFDWSGEEQTLETKLNALLAAHKEELASVYEAIRDCRADYE